MGYLLVTAVLVVSLGRLGDMYGRVRIYNLGFVVFTLASIALSLDPLTGAAGALWLIGFRMVQAVGGSMLMANSAAILTDAFPATQRGMALGVNQIAGDRRPVHRPACSAGCSPRGTGARCSGSTCRSASFGTIWAYRSLREISASPAGEDRLVGQPHVRARRRRAARLDHLRDPAVRRAPHGWTNPWVLGGLVGSAWCCLWRSA